MAWLEATSVLATLGIFWHSILKRTILPPSASVAEATHPPASPQSNSHAETTFQLTKDAAFLCHFDADLYFVKSCIIMQH